VSDQDFLKHSCDAWSIAIKTKQQGKKTFFPVVVVYPQNDEEVSRLLAWANGQRIPVTPWGAGSAVTGAPLPLSGGITVDMSRMDQINTTFARLYEAAIEFLESCRALARIIHQQAGKGVAYATPLPACCCWRSVK